MAGDGPWAPSRHAAARAHAQQLENALSERVAEAPAAASSTPRRRRPREGDGGVRPKHGLGGARRRRCARARNLGGDGPETSARAASGMSTNAPATASGLGESGAARAPAAERARLDPALPPGPPPGIAARGARRAAAGPPPPRGPTAAGPDRRAAETLRGHSWSPPDRTRGRRRAATRRPPRRRDAAPAPPGDLRMMAAPPKPSAASRDADPQGTDEPLRDASAGVPGSGRMTSSTSG